MSDVPPVTSSSQSASHNISLNSTSVGLFVCQVNSLQQSDMAIQLPEQQPLNGPAADSDGTGGLTGGGDCDQE